MHDQQCAWPWIVVMLSTCSEKKSFYSTAQSSLSFRNTHILHIPTGSRCWESKESFYTQQRMML